MNGTCFWSDEESLSGRSVANDWNGASEVLDWNAEFSVQHGSFCEFEVSEKGTENGERALRVRVGGVILAFSEGILGDFGLKSGESAEILPKMLDCQLRKQVK